MAGYLRLLDDRHYLLDRELLALHCSQAVLNIGEPVTSGVTWHRAVDACAVCCRGFER
jgi:hypothetical protein